MERSKSDNGWIVQGPAQRLLISQGTEKKLASAGFAVRDKEALDGLKARANERDFRPLPASDPFFGADAFSVTDPDGNRIVFGLSGGDTKVAMTIRGPLQHLTLATTDVATI
jgi:hypothetical protein